MFLRHSLHAGIGDKAIFTNDAFEKRLGLVKGRHHSIEVLYGLQVAVTKLSHPPSELEVKDQSSKVNCCSPPPPVLLNEMFNSVYNLEVANEDDFIKWKESGAEKYGRGATVMSVGPFMEWLQSADTEEGSNT